LANHSPDVGLAFNSLSRDHFYISRSSLTVSDTFNSLSRDHSDVPRDQSRCGPGHSCFQLPLSGSRKSPMAFILCHLGRAFQLPLSGSQTQGEQWLWLYRESFNSLSRDHLAYIYAGRSGTGSVIILSTPSLGITARAHDAADDAIDRDFQLPLSGSPHHENRRGSCCDGTLSTPSLGITSIACFWHPLAITFNSLSRDHYLERKFKGRNMDAFNSLSRDHRKFRDFRVNFRV